MLDIERQYYAEHLSELLDHCRDRFVVIKGTEIVGTFDTMDEALREGTRRFGLEPFLARRVEQTTPAASVPALMLGLLHTTVMPNPPLFPRRRPSAGAGRTGSRKDAGLK